jgi:integrase
MTKITKVGLANAIARLKVPPGARDVQIFDDKLPGFGLRKFASGKASFFVKFNVGKQQRRMSLGVATASGLEDARAAAEKILAKARLGDDAQAAKKAERAKRASTLGSLIPQYLATRAADIAPSYFTATSRYLNEHWKPMHGCAIEAVERRDVVRVLDNIADDCGKVAADRARAALSGFYAWAIDRSHADTTPVLHVKNRANGGGRDRVLSEDELAQVWRAAVGMGDYGVILRLLILTGQRKSEIGDLSWPEIDVQHKQIELPATRTKNKRAHIVPLSELAMAIINEVLRRNRRDFLFGGGSRGFQGWSRCKARLDEQLPKDMEPWCVHDLRRSVITHLNERGFADPHVIEAIANHVSGHKAFVAGIYNRSAYAAQKRAGLDTWAAHVKKMVSR